MGSGYATGRIVHILLTKEKYCEYVLLYKSVPHTENMAGGGKLNVPNVRGHKRI